MATATRNSFTPEALLAINDRPMPELINGQLVERETGQKADAVSANVCSVFARYAEQTLAGLVNGPQCGYQIFPDLDTVRVPSASYTRRERLPEGPLTDGHATVRPDLVAEVLFPRSNQEFVREKLRDFLAVGVSWAWMVDPNTRTVVTFQPDGTEKRFELGESLDGGDLLPGFHCTVDELFN
jgi:Uma2 family endonuclease